MEHAFDVALILHADHELNASTFAARVTAATLSDIYSAVTSAIGALKGPLHGGANEDVIQMLLQDQLERRTRPLQMIKERAGEQDQDSGIRTSRVSHGGSRARSSEEDGEELGKRTGHVDLYQIPPEWSSTSRKPRI